MDHYVKYTEFRNKAKSYIDNVENGHSYVIIRKGKPVAHILPFVQKTQKKWAKNQNGIKLKSSKTTLDFLNEERALS